MDIELLLTVAAGGLFGIILGKFMDTAPAWVFWGLMAAFVLILLYLAA